MKKIFSGILINIVIGISLLTVLKAQEIDTLNYGISISPAIVEVKEGESYNLNVYNKTSIDYSFSIEPAIFTFDEKDQRIVPVGDEQFINSIDLNNYIAIESPTGTLSVNGVASSKITYLKKLPDYFLGVWVKESRSDLPGVGIGNNIGSVILDYSLNTEEIGGVATDLDINSTMSFLGLNFGNNFKIESSIRSDIKKMLKANGEISISSDSTKISSLSLTQNLPTNIYPNQEVQVETKFHDSRGFFSRVGKMNVEQKFLINGETFTVTKQILVIPFEFIGVILVAFVVLFISLKIIRRRRSSKVMFKKKLANKMVR